MKTRIKKVAGSTKEFVKNHKVGLSMATGITAGLAMCAVHAKSFNDFLKDHDLYNEYYKLSK